MDHIDSIPYDALSACEVGSANITELICNTLYRLCVCINAEKYKGSLTWGCVAILSTPSKTAVS